jgi:hypothetical protein
VRLCGQKNSVLRCPLNFAAPEHVGREGLKNRLLAELESDGFRMANQSALPMADGGKRFGQPLSVPGQWGPILTFVDIYSPQRATY